MVKVHFVKKARKKNPVAKKGEPYYWWQFKFGTKRFSKTPPKKSQLTQSEFLQEVYSIQEEIEEADPSSVDDLEDLRSDWASRIQQIGEDCQSKLDNMPEQLQDSETGQLLQERISAMENWAQALEDVEIDFDVDAYIKDKLSELGQIEPEI